jgi:hypothetical protein
MNKVGLSLTLDLGADRKSVSREELEKALAPFGVISHLSASEYATRRATGLTKAVWLQINLSDEHEPYCLAPDECELSDVEITEAQLRYLREKGVCVYFMGSYPMDGDGNLEPPPEAVGHTFQQNAAFISSCGFSVSLDVDAFDAGHQAGDEYSAAMVWLKFLVPDNAPFDSIE